MIWRVEVQMRIALFSARGYERALLDELNVRYGHELVYFDALLEPEAAPGSW
jgi:D-lactate dehydrogenase